MSEVNTEVLEAAEALLCGAVPSGGDVAEWLVQGARLDRLRAAIEKARGDDAADLVKIDQPFPPEALQPVGPDDPDVRRIMDRVRGETR